MKYPYDLQTHSDLSDGDYSVKETIIKAKLAGLKGIVITDHNVASSFAQKIKLARRAGLATLMGVEISTKYNGIEIHILGYAKDFRVKVLGHGLKDTIDGYNARAKKIIQKIMAAGIAKINYRELKKRKGKGLAITKYDIAKEITKMTKIPIKQSQLYMESEGLAHTPYGQWAMSPMGAIKLIHRADGIAVLAHPGETYKKHLKKYGQLLGKRKFNNLIKSLLKNGLDGIELYSPKNDREIKRKMGKIIDENNLITTGGSDWHGKIHHPEIKLGLGGLNKKQFNKLLTKL